MNCASCGSMFNDGVQCSCCKNHYDFGCALITESGWRKLGNDRRATWRCASCKARATSPAVAENSALDGIMRELRDMKRHLEGLPTLVRSVNDLKQELSDIKSSCEFLNGKMDEFSSKVIELEEKISNLEPMKDRIRLLEADVVGLKTKIIMDDQRSRLNNAEIKGVPLKSNENLYSVVEAVGKSVNFVINKSQINYLFRMPTKSKEKSIVISFVNRYVKEDFLAAARAIKVLTASDIGFHGHSQRVYVNDHLSSEMKVLLNKAKVLAKDCDYKYVWVKFGKINLRKNDISPVLSIFCDTDLNKIK